MATAEVDIAQLPPSAAAVTNNSDDVVDQLRRQLAAAELALEVAREDIRVAELHEEEAHARGVAEGARRAAELEAQLMESGQLLSEESSRRLQEAHLLPLRTSASLSTAPLARVVAVIATACVATTSIGVAVSRALSARSSPVSLRSCSKSGRPAVTPTSRCLARESAGTVDAWPMA